MAERTLGLMRTCEVIDRKAAIVCAFFKMYILRLLFWCGLNFPVNHCPETDIQPLQCEGSAISLNWIRMRPSELAITTFTSSFYLLRLTQIFLGPQSVKPYSIICRYICTGVSFVCSLHMHVLLSVFQGCSTDLLVIGVSSRTLLTANLGWEGGVELVNGREL